ncbi:MAG TPA: hypothetical protein PKW35_22975, partial [Nannocystaceae bacterium]|nr:hypothetical protein [Nannocystaceae bacterium]
MLADPPNPEAIALSPLIGWLLAAAALVVALLALVHRRALARWWLSAEDPRPLALFRIVFALLLLGELADLSPHALVYFSDEGYFAADDAQELFAPVQFAGYGDGHAGDPRGFLDARGVLQHFRGQKYSLLYFHDSPAALALHQGLLVLAVLGLLVGLHTRASALVAFLLFNSLLYRDEIFWEGTELAYRCFFAYLVVARSGHAWSVDNWRRAARLRREGRLSLPGGPGGGAGLPPG